MMETRNKRSWSFFKKLRKVIPCTLFQITKINGELFIEMQKPPTPTVALIIFWDIFTRLTIAKTDGLAD